MILDYHTHYSLWEPECCTPNPDEDRNVEAMMAGGAERICLSGSNELVSRLAKKYPGFIIPFIYIRPGTDKPEVIKKYLQKGFKGLKFHLPKFRYDDERCFKYYELAEKAGLPTLFHTAISAGAGSPFQKKIKFSSDFTRPITLDRVGRCFPALKIVGAHLGYPWYAEALGLLAWFPNIYWDLTIGQLSCERGGKSYIKEQMLHFYKEGALNPSKLLYGSDSMLERPAEEFKGRLGWAKRTIKFELEALGLKQEAQELILGRNAEKLLGLSPL
ncbi:MAG: amidohydrolase family protein [Candidatus Firestonebacteria bacterium]